ncbi:MAG: bifunctional 5,10-methylenetetrahydrofolate dehydrogenase/5,10-methenyltetrahydrofolate cyclohydrolase [Clostridia bacterium]|nr:bifunctional 5,10-methylenetetrahydrofolate dehydrogenase/5,10-methenyltetrahydrofolate cyclohydrolase [Clostridia bacterium]
MQIIDGKLVSKTIREELSNKIKEAQERGVQFKLSVIIVGNDPASEIYVSNKAKGCHEVGILSETVKMSENTTQEELEKAILERVNDNSVTGILVQLPLPKHLDSQSALKLIPPEKDVDGFSDGNVGKLTLFKNDALFSCTPFGMIKLLEHYNIPLAGKHAVVVGRSNIVGKPMSLMLLNKDCTVTTCHSRTPNLADFTKNADILVCAVGKKHLITEDMVKDGVVVLDAGINRVDGKIYGDVDFDGVSRKASYITPVPGGVGPMTITMLLYNTYLAGINNETRRV